MKRASLIVIFGVVVLCAGAGCQSTLEIRVERVLTTGDSRIRTESRLGRRLTSAVSSLEDFIAQCASVKNHIKGLIDSKKVSASSVKYFRGLVQVASEKAKTLLNECKGRRDEAGIVAREEELQVTLIKVKDFFDDSVRIFNRAKKQAAKRVVLESLGREFVATRDLAATGTRKVSPGFGGFVAGDVYAIKPSDPMYATIFTTSSSRIKTSSEPITKVSIGVTGDSSIMLVVEHPGQIRVYQVSNDPTTIVRNIALLVSKATAAAAKFLASGTTP